MELQKMLFKVGIQPLEEISFQEKRYLIFNVVRTIIEYSKKRTELYCYMMSKLCSCKMYRARISEELARVNYIYQNKTIYFDENENLNILTEQMMRECIHAIQDKRNDKDKVNIMGLCTFDEFKVNGMALNESAIDYIINRIFEKRITGKINILLRQISLVVGEEILIKSVLNNKLEFEKTFMGNVDSDILYFDVLNAFDRMFDLEQELEKLSIQGRESDNIKDALKKSNIIKKEINNIFFEIQWQIYSRYFNRKINLIDQLDEIKECKSKLFDYNEWLEISEEEELKYSQFMSEKVEKLKKMEAYIIKKTTTKSLVVQKNNPFFAVIKVIKKLLFNTGREYGISEQKK